ncbi:MAG TPA: hypothetical protein VKU91_05705, partial [Acidimicrobiales bacterium]|nr:hypothetical protein [Acidimicrobiales bacterium]
MAYGTTRRLVFGGAAVIGAALLPAAMTAGGSAAAATAHATHGPGATATAASRSATGQAPAISSALAFSHETVVDAQRVTGEPSLSISPTLNSNKQHEIYVSTPYGFLTTASFVWRSDDGGNTFHLVPGNLPPIGKPLVTCVGGGDSNIVNDSAGNLYFSDLQGLTDVSDSVSTNEGRTWTTTCNQANSTGTDRPWISVYGDPLTTGREYMAVDDVEQCTVNCGLGQAGANMLTLTQSSGALAKAQVFQPLPAQQIEPDGIVSGTVVDQRTGDLYIVHTGFTDNSGKITGGSDSHGNDNAVVVVRFPGGYDQTVGTPIPPTSISLCKPYNATGPCYSETAFHAPLTAGGQSTVTVGQDFSPMAIDKAGNIYVAWAQAPVNGSGVIDGPSTIYMAVSADKGATWSSPIDVSGQIPGLQTNVFPWLAAGKDGAVDVVWYGTKALGDCSSSAGCGSSNVTGSWNVYMAQTLNAVTAGAPNDTPTFATTKVTEFPNHYGAICTFGISCSTGGDRGLLDFIQVQVAPSGAADVVWADSANTDAVGGTSSATIGFARQVAGPGLYGGDVSGPAPPANCAGGSPSSYYSANGTTVAGVEQLDIQKACVSGPNASGDYVITMKVKGLPSLAVPPTEGGSDVVWLTRWEYPTSPGAKLSHTDQGQVRYAVMESDNGGPPKFYAGLTHTLGIPNSKGTDQGFMLTYPPTLAATGSYTPQGLITITVPARYVAPGATSGLYSVTGITATQNVPSSTNNAIFNQIDATAPFDYNP